MDKWEHSLSVKKGDGTKVEMTLDVSLAGLDLDPFTTRGLKDFAANEAKGVRDGKETGEEFVARFAEAVGMYSRGEKKTREGGGITVDSIDTLANRILATKVLRPKYEADKDFASKAKTPIETPIVLDKKGNPNFLGWAKAIRASEPDHPWCVRSRKDAEADKGYE